MSEASKEIEITIERIVPLPLIAPDLFGARLKVVAAKEVAPGDEVGESVRIGVFIEAPPLQLSKVFKKLS